MANLRRVEEETATLRAATEERVKERDYARIVADERAAKLERRSGKLERHTAEVVALTEQRDDARRMVEERDVWLAERLRERDEARVWWKRATPNSPSVSRSATTREPSPTSARQVVASRRMPRRTAAAVATLTKERDDARETVLEREKAIARRVEERDEAREMVERRDAELAERLEERDYARAVAAAGRQGGRRGARGTRRGSGFVDEFDANLAERVKERDEARDVADERLKERDYARTVADERKAKLDEALEARDLGERRRPWRG